MEKIKADIQKRADFIKQILTSSRSSGIVFGNSGGKDCALVGILCKMATENVTGVIMPCGSRRNYDEDYYDAVEVANAFNIKSISVDLTPVKNQITAEIEKAVSLSAAASSNINPRLRMSTLYAIAQSTNCLVAGTGNKSEIHLGYFTKWGDGAYDFNPIADLTATEVYKYLEYLNAPLKVRTKAPSAALFDGQADEQDMGMTYAEIDGYLDGKQTSAEVVAKIERMHKATAHKRKMPPVYKK